VFRYLYNNEDVPPFVDFGGGHDRQAAVVTVSF